MKIHQRFEDVIADQEYHDKNVYEWFPHPSKDVDDEKKLLGSLLLRKRARTV